MEDYNNQHLLQAANSSNRNNNGWRDNQKYPQHPQNGQVSFIKIPNNFKIIRISTFQWKTLMILLCLLFFFLFLCDIHKRYLVVAYQTSQSETQRDSNKNSTEVEMSPARTTRVI